MHGCPRDVTQVMLNSGAYDPRNNLAVVISITNASLGIGSCATEEGFPPDSIWKWLSNPYMATLTQAFLFKSK